MWLSSLAASFDVQSNHLIDDLLHYALPPLSPKDSHHPPTLLCSGLHQVHCWGFTYKPGSPFRSGQMLSNSTTTIHRLTNVTLSSPHFTHTQRARMDGGVVCGLLAKLRAALVAAEHRHQQQRIPPHPPPHTGRSHTTTPHHHLRYPP